MTNDSTQDSAEATRQVCGFRWKIEQVHREGKQVTGLERCQCRKARIQRNRIGCAFPVWLRLKRWAAQPVARSINSSMAYWVVGLIDLFSNIFQYIESDL